MIDQQLHDCLDAFRAEARSAWLDGKYLRIYVRHNMRWFGEKEPIDRDDWLQHRRPCIANIGDMRIEHQLQGIFSAFLDYLESKGLPVFIENVQYEQLCWYYARRGYTRVEPMLGHTPSFYHLP